MSIMKILTLLCLLLLTQEMAAKSLYVDVNNTNCSDSTTYNNNTEILPWCSLGRAVWGNSNMNTPSTSQAAQAGDVVLVAEGIYATDNSTNSRFTPIYNPVNNGSSGNPITIQGQGVVFLRANNGAQPIIGTFERSYIVWDGFVLNETYIEPHSDTGPLVVWNSEFITIRNMQITGQAPSYQDNHNGIRIEGSENINIQNNIINNYDDYLPGMDMGMNNACFMAYESANVLIEHNECHDSTTGFFIKGDHNTTSVDLKSFTIRYNYIHDVQNAIQFGVHTGASDCSDATEVYQNLIVNASLGGVVFIGYDNNTPACVTVANNTMVNIGDSSEAGGILFRPEFGSCRGLRFHNNLITESRAAVISWDPSFIDEPDTTFSHNNYYDNDTVAYISQARTLQYWQTNYSNDNNTIEVDPQYTDANNGDYRTNNAALNVGLDILDLDNDELTNDAITIGAYITGNENIGLTDTLPDPYPAPPNPPSNIIIRINN